MKGIILVRPMFVTVVCTKYMYVNVILLSGEGTFGT